MADYTRSKSYAYGGSGSNSMQLQPCYCPGVGQSDLTLRCYSASYAQARADVWGGSDGREGDGEGSNYGKSTSGSRSKAASMSVWGGVADPEFRRKKRVACYKMYAVEGKVKGSFRKSSGGSRTGTLRLFMVGDAMAFAVVRAILDISRLKLKGQELLV